MAPRLHLLPVPALDGIVQRCALVVGKEITDILVVLELRPNLSRMLQRLICLHSIPEGLPGVLFQPFLKLHFEVETLAQVLLKEGPEFLRTYNPLRNGFIQRNRDVFLSFKHRISL